MRNLILFICILLWASASFAQENQKTLGKLPSVEVKTPEGELFNTKDISNNGNPIIISFWALWCKPCIKELTSIADVYDDWVEETGVKLIAVSVDDARSTANVMPAANGKGWEYEILLDPNSDFKRAMNVNAIPHTFVINGKGEIVWQHTSFSEGSELELIDIVRKVGRGEDISDH
ncbi:MAG: TlpA family protein disulfide reductase [Bacteroidales bacterium]|nr:TlpA family protein disulfide reductase [Bacteroidales bacterium]